jgi:hypothetical protein
VVHLLGGDDALNSTHTIPMTINAGSGNDDIEGGNASDTLNGDAGEDELRSNDGTNTLNGGAGGDLMIGGNTTDTLRGGDGNDLLVGTDGNDTLFGEGGNDVFPGEGGNDDASGGPGTDTANPFYMGGPPVPDVVVSLDDVANDRLGGAAGEADNIRSDIENVEAEFVFFPFFTSFSGNDTFTGNAAANTLTGGRGTDTIDGGPNNDVLNGGDDNDTLRARDGFADVVNCGTGADTADVDTLDTTSECEVVNVANVGNANDVPEDRPPTVEITAPGPAQLLRTSAANVVTANASDDKGVLQVLFVDDDRIVCADTAAPYACDYRARGEDVGRNTLTAIAVDTAQQTASALRSVLVDRFAPAGVSGRVTPARDTRAPFTFRTAGRLGLPAGVTPAIGCDEGQVSVQVKAGTRTISTRRAELRNDCSFASTVRFANRSRFTRRGTLRFTLRFTGNDILTRSAAVARNVRTRN